YPEELIVEEQGGVIQKTRRGSEVTLSEPGVLSEKMLKFVEKSPYPVTILKSETYRFTNPEKSSAQKVDIIPPQSGKDLELTKLDKNFDTTLAIVGDPSLVKEIESASGS